MHLLIHPVKKKQETRKVFGPQIVPLQMGTSLSYLILNGANCILVDAGNQHKEQKILQVLDQFLLPPNSLRLIVVTHTHFDHCGSLRALKEKTGAKVLVHVEEANCLYSGYSQIPKGTFFLTRWLSYLGRKLYPRLGAFPAVEPDIVVDKKYSLNNFGIRGYVLPTPGHSKGSLSLILEDKFAFVGDTLFGLFRPNVYPPFSDDTKEMLRSWKLLIETGCRRFFPGHGQPIKLEELKQAYIKYQSETETS